MDFIFLFYFLFIFYFIIFFSLIFMENINQGKTRLQIVLIVEKQCEKISTSNFFIGQIF